MNQTIDRMKIVSLSGIVLSTISSFHINRHIRRSITSGIRFAYHTDAMADNSYDNSIRHCKIALCQLKVGADKDANIQSMQEALSNAVALSSDTEKKIDIAVLPEVWNSPYSTALFGKYAEIVPDIGMVAEEGTSPSVYALCEQAKKLNIWLAGGSIPELGNDNNLYNTAIVINPSGDIVGKHRKVHLFDIDVPGKITFKESDSLTAGNNFTVIDTPWGGLGIGICYDIRFPEYAMILRKKGCKMILYPGAFNMVTGPAHWELLARARAVDNQLFVAVCSPARDTNSGGYVAWGHSSIVNPWGEVISKAGYEQETIFAVMDLKEADNMRENIPCWSQKRQDMYNLNIVS